MADESALQGPPSHLANGSRGRYPINPTASQKQPVWGSETVSANRVAAINPPIDDTDPIRNFSIDPGSHTDWQNPAEFISKGKPIQNFSIDPTSSIRTSVADAIVADAISETPNQVWERHKDKGITSFCAPFRPRGVLSHHKFYKPMGGGILGPFWRSPQAPWNLMLSKILQTNTTIG